MAKFKPFGPFKIPVKDGRVIEAELANFWNRVEEEQTGLQDAIGCYIFAINTTGSARPWYVGKTERASFRREAFQSSKILRYQEAMTGRRGTPGLYLIAGATASGKSFRRTTQRENGLKSIRKLEELLIGVCLLKNPKLVNRSTAKWLKKLQVPGYMNGPRGRGTAEANHLERLLSKTKK